MRGMGTIVNGAAVLIAGIIGIMFKKGIKQRFQDILVQSIGICVVFIGIAGALTGLLKVIDNGRLDTMGGMVLIGSMLIGSIIGEVINIEYWLERFGKWLRDISKGENDSKFIEGFIISSLTICIGAMAIVGSIEDGLLGNPTMLYTKSVLDFVIVIVFASTYGKGVIFSAIPVVILQGSVTIGASFIAPLLSENVIVGLSFVGSVLIFCVGANLCLGRKFKVANMLPSLLIIGFLANYI